MISSPALTLSRFLPRVVKLSSKWPLVVKSNRNTSCCHPFSSVPDTVNVPIDEAVRVTTMALQKIGWDEGDSKIQAEIMTSAEICGNNQGLVKMFQPAMMAPAPNRQKPTIERETATSAVINANQSPGMLAAAMASDLAVSKLEEDIGKGPISIVSAYNTSTSSGQLAYYVERMARKGYIGVAMCNSPEFVSAAQGAKPVFGTNPLAVGIPVKDSHPFTVRRRELLKKCFARGHI